MGKASQLKKLRRLAEGMPEMTIKGTTPTTISTGTALLQKGITEDLAGKPIDPKMAYKFPEKDRKDLNHYKRLKKAFKIDGLAGVDGYGKSVVKFAEQQKQTKENEHNLPE